jgi:hypothetical protein
MTDNMYQGCHKMTTSMLHTPTTHNMLKTCITWTQNVFRNAQVEKNEAKGRKGGQGKRILQQYSCTNCIYNYVQIP